MTANAGYHAFATGDVLTAAQVQYNLQNQTIMYFADSTARSTALSAVLVEGLFSYLADTDVTQYYNGSAWTTLGAGMTLISTTSLSGATTTISSIPQTYVNLFLVISGMTNATADGLFRIACNGVTTNGRGMGYSAQGATVTFSTTLLAANAYIDSVFNLSRTSAVNNFILQIPNYTNTTTQINYQLQGFGRNSTPADAMVMSSGVCNNATTAAISSIVFSNSGGNLSTGTVLLYGVK